MCDETERSEDSRDSEFWRAQKQLHRQLSSARLLSGDDRSRAERLAWDMYNRHMSDWTRFGS